MKYKSRTEHTVIMTRKELMERLKLGTPENLLDIDIRIDEDENLIIEWETKEEK